MCVCRIEKRNAQEWDQHLKDSQFPFSTGALAAAAAAAHRLSCHSLFFFSPACLTLFCAVSGEGNNRADCFMAYIYISYYYIYIYIYLDDAALSHVTQRRVLLITLLWFSLSTVHARFRLFKLPATFCHKVNNARLLLPSFLLCCFFSLSSVRYVTDVNGTPKHNGAQLRSGGLIVSIIFFFYSPLFDDEDGKPENTFITLESLMQVVIIIRGKEVYRTIT